MKSNLNQKPLRQQGAGINRLRLLRLVLAAGGMAAALGGAAGCGGEGGSGWGQGDSSKNKSAVTKEESVFLKRPGAGSQNLGMAYHEGFTAGRNSKSDFNMNWMMNWDKDANWRTEYDRGWKEGRNLRKMQDQRNNNA